MAKKMDPVNFTYVRICEATVDGVGGGASAPHMLIREPLLPDGTSLRDEPSPRQTIIRRRARTAGR